MKDKPPQSTSQETSGQFSTPQIRGERLKLLRHLTSLSRKELCEGSELNVFTYKGWELATFGGLTREGAEKAVKRFAKEGVICSTEWLLHGRQSPPALSHSVTASLSIGEPGVTDYNLIQSEFSVYQNAFKEAVLEEVLDDGLAPLYKAGEFLAGIRCYDKDILATTNKICIVQTSDGRKLIRFVKKGQLKGRYTLVCTNYCSQLSELTIQDAVLLCSAPISRHYIVE